MVKHIVFWKLNEEAKKNNPQGLIEDLRGRFKALVGLVEGLSSIELGANYNGNEFDVALVCEFTSREAEAAYQNHPRRVREGSHGIPKQLEHADRMFQILFCFAFADFFMQEIEGADLVKRVAGHIAENGICLVESGGQSPFDFFCK